MRSSIKLYMVISIIFALSACSKHENDAGKLEFYINRRVKESLDYVMDESPVFTGEDILSYEWDTHTIIFKEEFLSTHKVDETVNDFLVGGSQILGVYYPDQIVIYLNGKELYTGTLKPPAIISFMPQGPLISDTNNGIVIKSYIHDNDVENNTTLYEFLKENDLLG